MACVLYGVNKWLAGTHADVIAIGLYSFTPLLSAYVADGRLVWRRFHGPTRRTLPAYFLLPVLILVGFIGCLLALTYLSGALSVAKDVSFMVLVLGAVLAGWTFYGVFGLGEEYGWRGFLWDELRPLGIVNANVLTGIIWGLWHMPLVMGAYTYGDVGWMGVVAIISFTISMSFILSALRQATDSVIPSAALHGMINGASYVSALIVLPGHVLMGGLGGIVASFVMIVIGVAMWLYLERGRSSRLIK